MGISSNWSTEALRHRVYQDQMALLFQALPVALTANMVLAALLAYLVYGQVQESLLWAWLGTVLLLTGARLGFALLYLRAPALFDFRVWENFQTVAVVLSALLWSSTMPWMFPQISYEMQLLLVLVFAGLQFGVVSSSYSHPVSVTLFVGITSSAMIYALSRHSDPLSSAVIVLYVMYLGLLLLSGMRNYRHSFRGLMAGYEAQKKGSMLVGSEERFRAIVDNAGELVIVHDHCGRILDVNALATRVLGYSRAELVGQPINRLSDISQHANLHEQGQVLTCDSALVTKTGERVEVEACISRYHDPIEGAATLILARDLRMKRAAERELQTSRQKLALHMRSTPLAVIEWDADLRICAWNPAAERIFGYAEHEVLGKNGVELLVPRENRIAVTWAWRGLIQGNDRERSSSENLTRDGRRISCEWYHTMLVDDDGKVLGVASLAMDVTQRKQAEKSREEAIREAEKASRAKSEFLSKMSHELRTPLNAIIGFSDLLSSDSGLSPAQLDYMQEIRNAGQHLLALVNEVLDLSRIEHGKLVLEKGSVNMAEVLGTAVTMIRPLAFERDITIGPLPESLDVVVLGDKRRLTQVLINLLSNAVKYNREQGRIDVTCCLLAEDCLELAISDTGIGIADVDMDKVFQPFERAGASRSSVEGAGIGLMISRNLIEQMGGTLTFDSCEGIGSCFILQMPVQQLRQSQFPSLKQNIA